MSDVIITTPPVIQVALIENPQTIAIALAVEDADTIQVAQVVVQSNPGATGETGDRGSLFLGES